MRILLFFLPLIWSAIVYSADTGANNKGILSHFVQIKSSSINSPDTETKGKINVEKCAKLCIDNITCGSFEYDQKTQECFISKHNAKDYKVEFHSSHDYYQAVIPDESVISMKGVSIPTAKKLKQLKKVSVDDCVAKCRSDPKCKFISYKSRTKLCNLNEMKQSLNNQDLEVSKYGWDIYVLNQDEKEINCGIPPQLDFQTVSHKTTLYKSEAEYRCGMGEIYISTCGIDGTWSKPNGTCKEPASCKELKKCGEVVNDGEYWLYPSKFRGKKLKVFCSEMNTAEPKEYITLTQPNFSYFPAKKVLFKLFCVTRNTLNWQNPGKTFFSKIRIDLKDLRVNSTDFKFANLVANSGSEKWPYGTAADCLYEKGSRCSSKGEMKIDLTGTGLAVDRRVSWTNFGNNSRIAEYKRSANGQVVTATCGGKCGGCKPLCIKLVAASTVPDDKEARSCRYL